MLLSTIYYISLLDSFNSFDNAFAIIIINAITITNTIQAIIKATINSIT